MGKAGCSPIECWLWSPSPVAASNYGEWNVEYSKQTGVGGWGRGVLFFMTEPVGWALIWYVRLAPGNNILWEFPH